MIGPRVKEAMQQPLPGKMALLRVLLARARHDGCGGRAGRVELLTGIEGASRPVRRIALQAD